MVALFDPGELPRLLTGIDPAVRTLPTLERRLTALFPLLRRAGNCVTQNIIPTLDKEVPDGKFSTGDPVWQDLLHMVRTSPASQRASTETGPTCGSA